jgi:hypothetical protein
MSLLLAGVAALLFAVSYLGLVLPMSKPAPTFTAAGKVIGRVFQEAHAVGNVGYGMKAANQVQVREQYLIDVQLDSGEVLRGSWPVHQIDSLPVGARVNVRFQRRTLLLFWKRTFVDEIELMGPPRPPSREALR